MADAAAAPLSHALSQDRYFPWLLVLFAGSGCAALIYEVVWYQMLELVIGSTAVSLGVLLATFMGGLCLGSLALPRWLRARTHRAHPLHVYAALELATGGLGLAALGLIPLVDRLYLAGAAHGLPSMLLRGLLCAACLLPPTILMGASLPAIVNWIETSPQGVARWGLLYGANTLGAVVGSLAAGFYLLRVYDTTRATLAAVAVNLLVAAASAWVAHRAPLEPGPPPAVGALPASGTAGARRGPVLITIALSGLTALGAEVVWTRLMSLLLGATVYTFSLILAVFLVGLSAGAALGAAWGRRYRPRAALALCQLLLAGGIAWTAWMLGDSLPYWPVNPLLSTSPWFIFQIDLVRCLWTVLPAAVLWGASFPLALAAAARPEDSPGLQVGDVYAANTLGAIMGALAFSLVLVPWIGTRGCERLLIATAAASALLLLREWFEPWRLSRAVAAGAAFVAVAAAAATAPGVPGELIAYGRRIAISAGQSKILYTGEGRNASIAVSQWSDGALQFHVSGKVEASTEPFDMRLQRMLGHLPALALAAGPGAGLRSALVVGFGAGVTAGSLTLYPSLRRLAICEMEPLIPPASTRFFREQNYGVQHDPRTQIYYDDARHFVLTTPEHFDLITSDPIHPWVKGSATLYSREYFQMVRDHLNPGGVVTQWVPLYESSPEVVKSEIATFFQVFPNGSIWANEIDGGGYDVVLLGSNGALALNADALDAALARPALARVADSLAQVGFHTADELLATYAGQHRDLRPWLAGAEINRDGNLRLQYLAGLALNVSDENAIYQDMLQYRRFPSNLISGSPAELAPLRQAFGPR